MLAVVVALVLTVVSMLLGAPAQAQDAPSTTAVATTGAVTSTTAPKQTLVETQAPPDRRLATESRRVLAIIGALVAVALALTILTIRYWRYTRPVAEPTTTSPPLVLDDESVFVTEPEPEPVAALRPAVPAVAPDDHEPGPPRQRSVAGADHATADVDWEPRGTGEHAVVTAVPPGMARPGRAARKVALSRPVEP